MGTLNAWSGSLTFRLLFVAAVVGGFTGGGQMASIQV
jgi:hypothetical protein